MTFSNIYCDLIFHQIWARHLSLLSKLGPSELLNLIRSTFYNSKYLPPSFISPMHYYICQACIITFLHQSAPSHNQPMFPFTIGLLLLPLVLIHPSPATHRETTTWSLGTTHYWQPPHVGEPSSAQPQPPGQEVWSHHVSAPRVRSSYCSLIAWSCQAIPQNSWYCVWESSYNTSLGVFDLW